MSDSEEPVNSCKECSCEVKQESTDKGKLEATQQHVSVEIEEEQAVEETNNVDVSQNAPNQSSSPMNYNDQDYASHASENESIYFTTSGSAVNSTSYNQYFERPYLIENHEIEYQPQPLSQYYQLIATPQWNPSLMTELMSYPTYMPCTIHGVPYFMQPYWNQYTMSNLTCYIVTERIVLRNSSREYLRETYRMVYSGAELLYNNPFVSSHPMQNFYER